MDTERLGEAVHDVRAPAHGPCAASGRKGFARRGGSSGIGLGPGHGGRSRHRLFAGRPCLASRSLRFLRLLRLAVHLLLPLARGQHLDALAAVAVDGDALAALAVGKPVDVGDVLLGGGIDEVDGLGDGVVGVVLEGGLHAQVPLGGDVVGAGDVPEGLPLDGDALCQHRRIFRHCCCFPRFNFHLFSPPFHLLFH